MYNRSDAAFGRLLLAFAWLVAIGLFAVAAGAQGLTVLPVTIHMAPGQQAAVLTIENHETAEISFQVRPFAWSEGDSGTRLDPQGCSTLAT